MFRPCIDLHNGKVKQIVGSTLTSAPDKLVTNFETETSAAEFAQMYKRDNLYGGHVIMLGPGNEQAAVSALKVFPGGLQVGGGITPANAKTYLDAGASHIIITSYVFKDGKIDFEKLQEIVNLVGKQKLVLDLSCRKKEDGKYYVVTDKWQKFTNYEVNVENLKYLATFCDEFLVHAVDVEGMQTGILEDLLAQSPITVTYAGGAKTISDLEKVKTLGKGKVMLTIGSALSIFGGTLDYNSVVEWTKQNPV